MAVSLSELELEAMPELEDEFELEYEDEWESEAEAEQFFGSLAALAQRAAQSPALRRLALSSAQSALRAAEAEDEGEFEWEAEGEMNPLRRVYPDALMEHLGHAAAETESEAEAEAFIGALVPLAARLIPKVAPTIMRAAPKLIRGVTQVTRTLRRNPKTRPLVRTMPTIVRRTAATMARQAARGQPITTQGAVRALANQTARVLASPRQCVCAYQRSRTLDRQYHRSCGHEPMRIRPMRATRSLSSGCR
jgi:hypothetical protein